MHRVWLASLGLLGLPLAASAVDADPFDPSASIAHGSSGESSRTPDGTRSPAAVSTSLVRCLSIASALAATPEPV